MTYRYGSTLPPLPGNSLPNSSELFHIYEQITGYAPLLIVAFIDEKPVAKLLAVIRKSSRLFPPSFIKRCELFGTGEYFDNSLPKDELFGMMLKHLTNEVLESCFLIEVRNLPSSLFAYKYFRRNGYFPINWLRVYNSLHSLSPEERLEPYRRRQIARALKQGVSLKTATSKAEAESALQMLQRNYSSKLRKHFPDLQLFRLLSIQENGFQAAQTFLVKYKEKVIGASFCMYSEDHAYLCFSGGLRKTYAWLHPHVLAVWAAITDANDKRYKHFEFVDAGLPFRALGYRRFILSFGGKQVSTRRWFHFRWSWLNKLASWLYR